MRRKTSDHFVNWSMILLTNLKPPSDTGRSSPRTPIVTSWSGCVTSFFAFRVRLLRAFPEGADVARLQFARKLDTFARHTSKNFQVPAVDASNATVPEISRLRRKGQSGGAVTVGKVEFERVKLPRDRRR